MPISRQVVPLLVPAPVVAAGASTTFDPANKSALITLSGGNLVATAGVGAATGTNVRSIASYSAGKKYCEFTYTALSGTPTSMGVGLANGTFGIGVPTAFIGGDANSIAAYGDSNVYRNGGSVGAFAGTPVAADVLCMAVDFDNARIWFRLNGGTWNNGANDPATNVGGILISGLGAVAMFAVAEPENNTEAFTGNFGAAAYAQSVPSGFGNW